MITVPVVITHAFDCLLSTIFAALPPELCKSPRPSCPPSTTNMAPPPASGNSALLLEEPLIRVSRDNRL